MLIERAIGIGREIGESVIAAKIMMFAAGGRDVRRGGRFDRHAADRIGRAPAAFFRVQMIVHRRCSVSVTRPVAGSPNAAGRVRRWRPSWRFQNGAAPIDTHERWFFLGFSLPRLSGPGLAGERKSVVYGKSVSVRVDLGGRR